MAGVRPGREGTVEVVAQLVPERRVRAALDDPGCPVPGRQSAQIGEGPCSVTTTCTSWSVWSTWLNHRDDRRDGTTLGRRRRQEEVADCVAREVPAAADAVHDGAAHDVGGVHVAVDVGHEPGVRRRWRARTTWPTSPTADQVDVALRLPTWSSSTRSLTKLSSDSQADLFQVGDDGEAVPVEHVSKAQFCIFPKCAGIEARPSR